MSTPAFLTELERIYEAARTSEDGLRCAVAPHPELEKRVLEAMNRALDGQPELRVLASRVRIGQPDRLGFNDGVVMPPSHFPMGTSANAIRTASIQRAPLRGALRVAVILVDFPDRQFNAAHNVAHFEQLFFSENQIPTGSVREYYREVTHGLVDIQGQVVGPLRMPRTLEAYSHNASGIGDSLPNARTMARDAALAANPTVNFAPFDNDGDGFVDAFVVVHAGPGAEVNGNPGDIWSHKWVLDGGELQVDSTRIFAYLTVPEDALIGVCCHELGHLLFGFPDLYDSDGSSSGVGDWCLMAGGSWGGNPQGTRPTHPCAWCKANQEWVDVENVTQAGAVSIPDVKSSQRVHRLWKGGAANSEYFLIENRQKDKFDGALPAAGLLIWHIDENVPTNSNESRYKVALVQADGEKSLEGSPFNRGDAGDPYPGSANNRSFSNTSTPNSRAYNDQPTNVSVTEISPSAAVMTARLSVGGPSAVAQVPARVTLPQLISRIELLEQIVLGGGSSEETEAGSPDGNGDGVPLLSGARRS